MSFSERAVDTISFLLGERPEAYPFEKLAEFGRFTTWMAAPNDDVLIELGAKAAVARGIHETSMGRNPDVPTGHEEAFVQEVMNRHFPPRLIVTTLLFTDGLDNWLTFMGHLGDAELAADIAAFLLTITEHPVRPSVASMNRAVHFVCNSGFVKGGKTYSHLKVKEAWSNHSSQTPFVLAANFTDWFEEWNPPNHFSFFRFFRKNILGDGFAELVSIAFHLQHRLEDVLSAETKSRLNFFKFPQTVEEQEVTFSEFDREQRKLILSYRASSSVAP